MNDTYFGAQKDLRKVGGLLRSLELVSGRWKTRLFPNKAFLQLPLPSVELSQTLTQFLQLKFQPCLYPGTIF